MDNQLPSPNTPSPAERPAIVSPDALKPSAAEAMPSAPVEPQTVVSAASPAVPPVVAPAPVTPAAPVMTPNPVVGSPAIAGDVDVIETEWVDKAEQVIAAHQGDPYGEEEAIEKLQEDYLQKRYGMNVADPNSPGPKPNGS
jgi:hypothetical protein